MRIFTRLLFVFLACWLSFGCSDSTTPTTNYPLTLSLDTANQVTGYLAMVFSLRVTKNGAPFSGATIMQTDEIETFENTYYLNSFNQNTFSDSTGTFPEFVVYYDSVVVESEFQAFKDTTINNVKDTLMSNPILYVMP
jgi:hypothetical protein